MAADDGVYLEEATPAFDVDLHIGRLFDCVTHNGKNTVHNVLTDKSFLYEMLARVMTLVQSEPPLLEIEAPICICGDIHGQYTDLLRIFESLGKPSVQRYLFLGDYIDRGPNSLEVISLLFLLKIRYPDRIFLLRGNHECSSINFVYGFHEEMDDRFSAEDSQSLWTHFQDVFNWMPLVALVGGKILCMHGGISPTLNSIDQLRHLERPTEPGNSGLHIDLLWADPNKDMPNDSKDIMYKPSMRGISFEFSEKAVYELIVKLNVQIIVRAHQVVMQCLRFIISSSSKLDWKLISYITLFKIVLSNFKDGYEFFANRHLVTVFTASNYCGKFGNKGAVMLVSEDYCCSFKQFEPRTDAPTNKRLQPKEVILDDIDSILNGD